MFTANRIHLYFIVAICMFTQAGLAAADALRLPHIFSDNMILQCGQDLPVWGWAKSGTKVSVAFAGQTINGVTGKNGKWMIKLKPLTASAQPARMLIKAGTTTRTLKNVLVGEVWLCSGQSNMEFSLQSSINAKQELAAANYPAIREFYVPHAQNSYPQDDVVSVKTRRARWFICTGRMSRAFSATGYFFARKLHQALKVPVGIVVSSWGGTIIQPWIPPIGFRQVGELKDIRKVVDLADPTSVTGKIAYEQALTAIEAWLIHTKKAFAQGRQIPAQPQLPVTGRGPRGSVQGPTRIYNGMIHPLIPYAIKGAVWYQGESNGREGNTYYHKQHALIQGWRTLWEQGDFPFFFVQLPNYRIDQNLPAGGNGWAKIRDAQRKCLTIPNTGMIVTIDIGETYNIHPKNKQDVGQRLALWALNKTYGKKNIVYSGPLYKSHKIEGNAIRIKFNHVGSGLMVGKKVGLAPTVEVKNGILKRFAISDVDKKWYWADACIDNNTIVVSSPKVTVPVAVHYAYSANPLGCNLYNREGLPAAPFSIGVH